MPRPANFVRRVCLTGTLAVEALDLQTRALWVEAFEHGGSFGGAPGTPIQDPVNSATGNLVHTEDDFVLPSRGGLKLQLSRTYNSRDTSTASSAPYGPLGPFGAMPGLPGEGGGVWPPSAIDAFSSGISGSTTAADAWMKRVNDLYKQADRASRTGKTALRDWLRYDQMMRDALNPDEARAYARAVDYYAEHARGAFKTAGRLRGQAGAVEDALPGARKIAGL